MADGPISPDCADGKCPCTGDAFDLDLDEVVPCQHFCHGNAGVMQMVIPPGPPLATWREFSTVPDRELVAA